MKSDSATAGNEAFPDPDTTIPFSSFLIHSSRLWVAIIVLENLCYYLIRNY